MNEPLVFAASYESLIRALGPALDARARARFREHGVDFDKPLAPAYPLTTWVKSLEVACELLAPGQPRDAQSHIVGRRIVLSFTETTVGKALFALLRIMGPHRGLERMRRSLRMSNNYSETPLEQGPEGYELWCNLVTFPHYYRGLFEAGLESVGA
jgi:uncharacterized protein (TIGR02265 family)